MEIILTDATECPYKRPKQVGAKVLGYFLLFRDYCPNLPLKVEHGIPCQPNTLFTPPLCSTLKHERDSASTYYGTQRGSGIIPEPLAIRSVFCYLLFRGTRTLLEERPLFCSPFNHWMNLGWVIRITPIPTRRTGIAGSISIVFCC